MAKNGGVVSSIDHEFEAKPQQQAHKKGFSGQRNGSTERLYINQDAEGCAKNDAQNHPVGVLENEIAGPNARGISAMSQSSRATAAAISPTKLSDKNQMMGRANMLEGGSRLRSAPYFPLLGHHDQQKTQQ